MFVQIMIGDPADTDLLRSQMEVWQRDLAPGAAGWLGATAGQSTQGPFIAVVRFDSEEAARANSDRPEQGEWWKATEAAYDGPVTFVDSTDTDTFLGGGSDDAGFVQIMRSTVTDRARFEEVDKEMEDLIREARPDVLGGLRIWESGDRATEVVYFASEEAARQGEAADRPDELAERFEEWQSLMSDTTFYDLRDPWLYSA